MNNTDILTDGQVTEKNDISGEELFQAYQEGKSFDDLKAMFAGNSEEVSEPDNEVGTEEEPEVGVSYNDTLEEEVVPEEEQPTNAATDTADEKPFRVFKTKEDFQKVFDRAWGERHADTMRKMTEQEKQIDEMTGILSTLLGVSKEDAFSELQSRRWAAEAEKEGYENPEQYAQLKRAENRIAEMEQAEQQRRIDEQIADIRRQGDALSAKIKGFDLDSAMSNVEFKNAVFSLQQSGAKDSVEKAFRAVFFDKFMKQSTQAEKPARPKEGATTPKSNATVKPVNVAGLSGSEIREIEKRILRGEKVQLF